jgi:hypothetical protein
MLRWLVWLYLLVNSSIPEDFMFRIFSKIKEESIEINFKIEVIFEAK